MHHILRAVFILALGALLAACGAPRPQRAAPRAGAGALDLRGWDFVRDGPIALAGEWQFFWQVLEPGGRIDGGGTGAMLVPVPESWSSYTLDGRRLPAAGYATYALTVDLPEPARIYGIYIEGEGTAYRLWADGALLAQRGQVATSRQAMIPESSPQTVYFQPRAGATRLVMQIANFYHRKGGFRNAPLIGLPADIDAYRLRLWAEDAFSMGVFLVLGAYHLAIFAYRRSNVAPLFFAAWCLLYFVRTGILGQEIIQSLFPALSWALALRIEYLTFYLSAPLYALFIRSLYPDDFPRLVARVIFGLGLAFSIGGLVIDTLPLSYTVPVYQAIILAEIVYAVYFLSRILIRRRPEARYVGGASVIIFAGVIVEILYVQDIFPYRVNVAYSFLGFLFIQAILLASRLSRAFHRAEALSDALETSNRSLQVSEQTYRSIFEGSKDLIFLADREGQISDANPAGEQILGFSRAELLRMSAVDLLAQPADRERLVDLLRSRGEVSDYTIELRRRDGRVIRGQITLTLRRDASGAVSGVQGQVHDLSAHQQAEAERERAQAFEQLAFTDPLTQIYNRRFFDEIVLKEWERSRRGGTPLALIIFDIDHFKQINDTYGHPVGDQVLVGLARLCQAQVRGSDLLARYGGEEFVILMPGVDRAAAQLSAERLRRLIAGRPLVSLGDQAIAITISVGVAAGYGRAMPDLQTLIERADQALYDSKHGGRNRVTVWER